MKALLPREAARAAVAAHPGRPATALVHDSPDLRLIVFRLAPGQEVAPHRNASSVMLTVLSGSGVLTGEGADAHRCTEGECVLYAPNELHGMRAEHDELVLLATITPRPGSR